MPILFSSALPSILAVAFAFQAPSSRADTLPRPRLDVLRVTERITIDGRLDEPVWQRAEAATDWVQSQPQAGRPASERSEARVLIDGQNLYVGIRLYDRHPDSIGVQLARRDVDDTYTDRVWVGFDSYGDRRTAFAFAVSPLGVQSDGYGFNDNEFDPQWDAVWQSQARIDSLGWTAEMRIPLSQLRYTAGDSTRDWGVQFMREIARRGEESYWSPRDPTARGDVSRYGVLTGLGAMNGALPVEAIPYARSQLNTRPPDPGNPFHANANGEMAFGVDLRARLPKSLSLTATINPDFGQVEADPAVVNLSAFEVFFPERRPFFLENLDAFRFGGTTTFNDNDAPNFFYTRRVGRAPRGELGGDFSDIPAQTPILAAFKLSGTTPSGWAIGSLNATTARESGRAIDIGGPLRRGVVEPQTNSHVTRVRRLLRGGYTSVGGFTSWVERERGDSTLASLLPQRAIVGGLDFDHAIGDRAWTFSGVLARSNVRGEASAIARLQRANYRLLQRPDATHLTYDPTRTALDGGYYSLSAAKTSGRLTGSMTAEQLDAGFETNDAGFQQRSDLRSVSTGIFYRQPQQTTRFQAWSTGAFSTVSWNTAGDNLERRVASFNEVQFRNFWELSIEGNVESGRYNDRLLRGGPMATRPVAGRVEVSVSTDERRPLILSVGSEWSGSRAGNRGQQVGVELDWRPLSALRIRVEPEVATATAVDQYVTVVSGGRDGVTGGARYVFANVEQREARLNTRLDWTFSPYVSVQLFVQPFASTGRFSRYKEFLRPRDFAFGVYGEDQGTITRANGQVTVDPDAAGPASPFGFSDRDYTARELRGNAVLRWELRPGSTVFVVWQQSRESFDGSSDPRNPIGQLGSLFDARSRNVFLVKLAWWLGR